MRLTTKAIVLFFILLASKASIAQSVQLDSAIVCEFPSELQAYFPGGKKVWDKYILRRLDLSIPKKKGAPIGVYTVEVRFQITKTGKIDSIFTTTHHGYGMEKQVVRILRKAPKWTPALKNGRSVAAWMKHYITFQVRE